jgi:hypothetical protein
MSSCKKQRFLMYPRVCRQASVIAWSPPGRRAGAGAILLLAFCLVLLLPRPSAAAPLIGWGKPESSVEAGYFLQRQTTSVLNAPDSTFDSDRFRERLNLKDKQLFVLDPRLVTFNLGASVELFQERNDFSGQSGRQDGTLLDYSLDSTFFSRKPYDLRLFANRTDDRVSRNFGTRTEVTSTNHGARASLHQDSFLKDLGFAYFTSSLGMNQFRIREDSSGNGQDFHRSEDHNVVQYDAHKGFQTADLGFHYQYDDVTDNLRADNGFSTHRADLNYSLDFGPTLNRRWNSIMNYLARSGPNETSSYTANESLIINHNVDLFSSYQYSFNRFNSVIGTTTTQTAGMLVSKRTYRNLTSGVHMLGTRVDQPEGQTRNYGAGPSLSYRRHVPANGLLTLRGAGTYRITDNNLHSSNVEVQNEPHTVGPSFPIGDPGFLLSNPFVLTSSIVMIDTRGGGQLPLTAGVDYEVLSEGDGTRIRPLPTSAILQANDPLEASYTYMVAPSIKFSTTLLNLGGGINFGWLSFSLGHDASKQRRISGTDNGYLQDRTLDHADLRLRGDWQRLRATGDIGYQREDSTSQKYTRWTFGQSGTYTQLFGMMFTAGASESFTSYSEPVSRRSESYAANISLSGVIGRGWLTRGYANILTLRDTNIESQTTRRVGVNTKKYIGKLTLTGDLLWDSYERGPAQTVDRRIELTATRRF